MEWSNDEVIEFLQLYEAHPQIWNPRHPDHENSDIVHDAWKEIENKLSVKTDISEMKKKEDFLTATYRKLLNKVKASKGTGSGAKDVIKPDWFAYNAMEFLHGIYAAKKSISTEFENLVDDDNMIENCQLHDTTEIDDPQTPDCDFKSPSPSSTKISKKRKSNDKVEVIENKMDEVFTIFKQITQTPAKNKCTLFTDLLCAKLESLNEYKQDIAMMEIDNLMFRLKHSDNKMVQPQLPFYQFPSTNIRTYSQQLHHDNYSTASSSSSSSSSFQPQPSPEYISFTPSTYHQHFQQLQKPTPTTLQHSNVGEKSFDQDSNFGSLY